MTPWTLEDPVLSWSKAAQCVHPEQCPQVTSQITHYSFCTYLLKRPNQTSLVIVPVLPETQLCFDHTSPVVWSITGQSYTPNYPTLINSKLFLTPLINSKLLLTDKIQIIPLQFHIIPL